MRTRSDLPTPFSLIRLDSVGSTNDEARRLALSGAAADLLVVSAIEQTQGRGRRARPWLSPPGNLHCSTLIRIDGDLERLPLSVLAHGDSTPAAIRAAARRDAQVDTLICHGGLVDRAGLQSLQLLTAPLLMLFEHDDDSGPPAWERASRHLGGPHAMHRLAAGESPLAVMLQWLKTPGTG